jgi:hypothetical protein
LKANRAWLRLAVVTTSFLSFLPPGHSSPLSYHRALTLAMQRNGESVSTDDRLVADCTGDSSLGVLNMIPRSVVGDSLQFYSFENTSPPTNFASGTSTDISGSPTQTGNTSDENKQIRVAVCATLAFAALGTLNLQLRVLALQEAVATGLLTIEERRIKEHIDNEKRLTQAKLLAARTRVWAEVLNSSVKTYHQRLADLTGLTDPEIDPDLKSIPPLPLELVPGTEIESTLKQLAAARDVFQLEYFLLRTSRKNIREKMVVGKANLGDLMEAYINECQKFNQLIDENFQLQTVRLKALEISGQFKNWASGSADLQTEREAPTITKQNRREQYSGLQSGKHPPGIRSIMITPGIRSLAYREPQQFSAIVILDDNTSKNMTLQAEWKCSTDWAAIVSSTGLVTGFDIGEVRITATVSGVTETHLFFTTPEPLESDVNLTD